ncbi:NADPH-dependent FMN reductase [Rhizobacter sp. Root404]|jgi:chromate reductase|uniref:NADPH-dependent FMN reductase n=1 Tax=Rhizobacter sp. Root404 TaxID=1736528 RepID=UPI000700119E|nr:NADPH-dependent FMN reductase [Rhizobacter sp. Root404]KQW37482.1 NADPH-dependent FMN reductase [Rhizobacter sp. Root404]
MTMHQVAVIVGSLRRESINLRLAHALAGLAGPALQLNLLDLSDLPLYNDDLWQAPPDSVLRLKRELGAADGVLFVTPEYNRGVPAVTKNVVDWGSRPMGQSVWPGKPTAIVGTSPGAIGTAVAQSQLRGVLASCGVRLLGQAEVYLQNKPGLIADDFSVTDEKTRGFLQGFLGKFAAHLEPGAAR